MMISCHTKRNTHNIKRVVHNIKRVTHNIKRVTHNIKRVIHNIKLRFVRTWMWTVGRSLLGDLS